MAKAALRNLGILELAHGLRYSTIARWPGTWQLKIRRRKDVTMTRLFELKIIAVKEHSKSIQCLSGFPCMIHIGASFFWCAS